MLQNVYNFVKQFWQTKATRGKREDRLHVKTVGAVTTQLRLDTHGSGRQHSLDRFSLDLLFEAYFITWNLVKK